MREARDHDGRCCLERLVTMKLSRLELLSHAELDLALGGYTEILQELPDRHVEDVVVHTWLLDSLDSLSYSATGPRELAAPPTVSVTGRKRGAVSPLAPAIDHKPTPIIHLLRHPKQMLDLRCGPLGTAFSANQYFGGDAEVRVVGLAVAGALLARSLTDQSPG
jgi:hypothetical protein